MHNETSLQERHMMLEWGNWIVSREKAQMTPRLSTQDSRCCPNRSCSAGAWNVELLPDPNSLWRVSNEANGAYLVASTLPACPMCGADLPTASERTVERTSNEQFNNQRINNQLVAVQ